MSDERWSGVPVAWASVAENGQPLCLGYDRPIDATAVPLYRHQKPALTDAEREAVDEAARFYGDIREDERCQDVAATLRKLLDRTETGGL